MNLNKYTNQIYARKFVEDLGNAVYVDWAMKLIENDIESEHLIILAGVDKSSNIEINFYFMKSIHELGVKLYNDKSLLLNIYTINLYNEIESGRISERRAIGKMWKVCELAKFDNRFGKFYNLHQDVESIEYGEGNVYDKNLNKVNYALKVRKVFEKFVEKWG